MLVGKYQKFKKPDIIEWCRGIVENVLSTQRVEDMHMKLSSQQEELIKAMYEEGSRNIIKTYRRSGLSMMMSLVAAYRILYNGKSDSLFVTSNKSNGCTIKDTILYIFQECDKVVTFINNEEYGTKLTFEVDGNVSTIKFITSSAGKSVRGNRYKYGYLDNCAFYGNNEETEAILASFDEDSSINAGSCPNGKDKFFYKQYMNALDGMGPFKPLSLQWYLDDRYSDGLRFINEEGFVIDGVKPTIGNICEYLSRGYHITSKWREEMKECLGWTSTRTEVDAEFFEPTKIEYVITGETEQD